MLNFHFLQYTLFFFIPAILLCIKLKRWIGFFILVSNFVCSFIVHRINRKEESELCDYCDNYAIYLWIFYNIYLVVKITSNLKTNKNIIILCFIILSLCSAYLTYYYNKRRLIIGKWRSKERNINHGLMHFFGGIGTLFLLLAINKIDKKCSIKLVSI
tara:strand:- start:59 stop:532 length:474 start_codon:yes stop_codon:yes gene_type:complete